jgi:hypothetical protein
MILKSSFGQRDEVRIDFIDTHIAAEMLEETTLQLKKSRVRLKKGLERGTLREDDLPREAT